MGGFATSSTRGSGKLARELEERTKHLDVFTDEFSPPGSPRQTIPGQDVTKGVDYQKPHDDGAGRTDLPVNRRDRIERGLSAAGNAEDQKPLDDLDKQIQAHEGKIKSPADQFPTGYEKGLSMPFESQKQRGFMWWKHPEIAKRWEKETPSDAALPKYKASAMSEADDDEGVNREKAKLFGPNKLKQLEGVVEKRLTKLSGVAEKHLDAFHGDTKVGGILIKVGFSSVKGKWAFQLFKDGIGHISNSGAMYDSESEALAAGKKEAQELQ